MKEDLQVKNGIVIPGQELEIATSRAGGPGGQHVNKSNTRVSIRWNIRDTSALSDHQKERVFQKLHSQLTSEGEIIVHCGASRSQQQNKKAALELLIKKIRKALHVSKKRMKTAVPRGVKEKRLKEKKQRGAIKKMRGRKGFDD